ncbi:hypothetical protein EDB89DRAFT_1885651 [Lactarius sanguifluus]|nr:hypothetical protein EDB89DRAFT_2235542 [Lactarius sanguifluus]KAH9167087.1 hypothetical protein EDB89DRAFT_2232595 [Lactarius sanguifluus]KAH9172880.1 hypothetical protein EDB89DRAFT_1885651 [Lactarius sanguifluus]
MQDRSAQGSARGDEGQTGSRSARMSRVERFGKVLALLREGNLSPFDLILEILDDCKPEYTGYRVELYKDCNRKLPRMLDSIHAVDSGRAKLWSWMEPHALEHVCGVIDEEMDLVNKTDLLPGLAAITPDFIKSWAVSSTHDKAPFLTGILLRAAETSLAKEKNKIKHPDAMCDIIVRQLSYQRSNRVLGFPALFGLFLWSSGCSRQTIEALHRCGLSVCFTSVMNNIAALADQCLKLAVKVGSGPHVFCYDNIQISTSIFVEQRGSSGPAKVTSGTFGVLYKVRNGRPEQMKLAPILERFGKTKGLDFNRDIRPTDQQLQSFQFQLKVVIIRVLTTYSVKFRSYAKDPALQHVSRRPMPPGYKTEQFPIRVSTIEEATVRGNLLFHDDVFLTQLKRTTEDLCEHAIPTFNDQLTNSRIRSGQILRARDTSHWTRREVFQLGFGLFHLCLNLVWALLHVHRGSLDQTGSLAYFFALLEKTRLGGDHPDYHTLLSALTQILDGILLNAWKTESGYSDLAEFAATEPSAEELLGLADNILCRHATPMIRVGRLDDDSPADEDDSDESDYEPAALSIATPKALSPTRPDPDKDKAHQNLRLLTRDLLYLAELVRAISDGDIGRIEDFLPQLAMMFRGSGGNNYCTEILHFLLNLKHIWTPEFADIMRDNMLVNVSGLTGHAMPIDLNIEHLIGELKKLLQAKGLKSTWDRLGNISAAIDIIKKLKKRVSVAMKTAYQGTTHTDPKTDHLVWRVSKKVREEQLHMYTEDRPGNAKAKAVPDILAMGEVKLLSSSLNTFNRKFCAMAEGRGYDEELDSLPQMALAVDPDGNNDADESTDELTAE